LQASSLCFLDINRTITHQLCMVTWGKDIRQTKRDWTHTTCFLKHGLR
jgi:hypothetical protein